jgi:hypothetical protein
MDLEIDALSPKSKLQKLDKEAADDAARLSMSSAQAIVAQEMADYVDTRCIQGTTVSVERCFSVAKVVLTDNRLGMTPYMFETYMFL